METNIKRLRTEKGLSLAKLGEISGISPQYLNKLEKGERRLNHEVLLSLSKALECDVQSIITVQEESKTTPQNITLIRGEVSAGLPTDVWDVDLGTCSYPNPKGNLFALVVNGDSMNNYAHDGDLVIVDPSQHEPRALNGKRIIVLFNSEHVFKKLQLSEQGAFLLPESSDPRYKPIFATKDCDLKIIGRVINKMGLEDKD